MEENISDNSIMDVSNTVAELQENPNYLKDYFAGKLPGILDFLVQLVVAVLILFVGFKIVKGLMKIIGKSFERSKLDKGVASFLESFIRYALYFLVWIFVLAQFGITTSSLIAVLGSAGLTIGLALQGSLANFAGGVILLIVKPFVLGDYIVDESSGKEGTVTEMTIMYTKLTTPDNRVIMIPNGTLSNATITNVSAMKKRRIDITVGVAYESSLSKVKNILMNIALNDEAVMKEEPLNVFVSEIGESSISVGLRVWVAAADFWPCKWRITEEIKNTFDRENIKLPYPQIEIHTSACEAEVTK